jgi:hypothetical protein
VFPFSYVHYSLSLEPVEGCRWIYVHMDIHWGGGDVHMCSCNRISISYIMILSGTRVGLHELQRALGLALGYIRSELQPHRSQSLGTL